MIWSYLGRIAVGERLLDGLWEILLLLETGKEQDRIYQGRNEVAVLPEAATN